MVREAVDPSLVPSEGDERLRELERTIASLREDSEVAHVLLGLSGALAEVRSVAATLDTAVKVVAEIMGADRAFAATWADKRRFRIQAHTGYNRDEARALLEHATKEGGLPLLRKALADRKPMMIEDASSPSAPHQQEIAERKLGAYVGLPLSRWGEEIGGIALEYSEPRVFGTKETALARGISRQVGVALVNARRFNLLGGLRAFGLSVASRLRLDAVIDQVSWGATALLGGDAGAVYFLDATNSTLIAAGGGFETLESQELAEEVKRIDLGEHPWGQLLQGRAILVPDLGPPDAPVSVVAAPIPGEHAPILGSVMVFFERSLKMAPDEIEALSVLAGQAGMAVENAQRFERSRRVARSLQTGLLSTELPKIPGVSVAAFYEPASGEKDIGGDFYDVFDLPDGRYALVVGDVSGKGAEAAARTAMAKYMLRAFATRNPTPSSVMYHLNNALAHDLESERFATLVYGVLDPTNMRLSIARGGHPPPMVYRRDEDRVEVYEDLQGSLIGAFPEQQFQQETFDLGPGDVFLLYTDGLIEARSATEGFYGRRRIERALCDYGTKLDPEAMTKRIYQDAADWGEIGDDTVVFALTREIEDT